MKAETADTIYREIVRRSSADGLAYLRDQLAAHEAKWYGLCVPGGEALRVEWADRSGRSGLPEADFGNGLNVTIEDCGDGYEAFLDLPGNGGRVIASGATLDAARAEAEEALPAALAELVNIGRAAARALRGGTGE